MRKPLIAGNWKMHKTAREASDFIAGFLPAVTGVEGVDIALCPPFPALEAASRALSGSSVALGAQDCFWLDKGAFTGQVSPPMLEAAGCKYVIVGHSERRGRFGNLDEVPKHLVSAFGDTDSVVNAKVCAALQAGLVPILCVGETLPERKQGLTDKTVASQLEACLAGVAAEQVAGVIVAYEPVWAIGTGQVCDAGEAERVIGLIRSQVSRILNPRAAEGIRIQYGGSVKPENTTDIMSRPQIDGALVGGASLDATSFAEIVKRAEQAALSRPGPQ
jgi:triosephosphate isomerase